MTDFAIRCWFDPGVQDMADYTATYAVLVGGDEAYQGLLCRRQGVVLPSRFETLSAGHLPFDIYQTSSVGRRKIEVREAFAGVRIGEMRDLRLYFDGANQIVGLHDPATLGQRLARAALRRSPDQFIFRRAVDRGAIGWIATPPSAHPWLAGIRKGFKRSIEATVTEVWQGQLDKPDLDLRPFIAAAVILHSDCE